MMRGDEVASKRQQLWKAGIATCGMWSVLLLANLTSGRLRAAAAQGVGLASSLFVVALTPRITTLRQFEVTVHSIVTIGAVMVSLVSVFSPMPIAVPVLPVLATAPVAAYLLGTRAALAWGLVTPAISLLTMYVTRHGLVTPDRLITSDEWLRAYVMTDVLLMVMAITARRAFDERHGELEATLAELATRNDAIERGRAELAAAHDELATLNAELEARVAARTRDLAASEERFARLFRHAPQAMVIVDPSGHLVQANGTAHRVFRVAPGELTGRSAVDVFPDGITSLLTGDAGAAAASEGVDAAADGERTSELGGAVDARIAARRVEGSGFEAEVSIVAIELDGRRHALASVRDVSDEIAARAAIDASLREKETLLREIHHRVKNNMQVVSSLLTLQADQLENEQARQALRESVQRVRSMALIHQKLYGESSLARVDMGSYTRALSATLIEVFAPDARVQIDVEGQGDDGVIEVEIDRAVPLGLILNELLTNACKYGLRGGHERAGDDAFDIRVRLALEGTAGALSLVVEDRGPGLPVGFEVGRSRSLGLQLVKSLARQLRGKLKASSGEGARFELVFAATQPP